MQFIILRPQQVYSLCWQFNYSLEASEFLNCSYRKRISIAGNKIELNYEVNNGNSYQDVTEFLTTKINGKRNVPGVTTCVPEIMLGTGAAGSTRSS